MTFSPLGNWQSPKRRDSLMSGMIGRPLPTAMLTIGGWKQTCCTQLASIPRRRSSCLAVRMKSPEGILPSAVETP